MTTTDHDTRLDPIALITPEVVEAYRRDGVVFLPQALHPEWLLLVELGLQRVLGNGGRAKHKFFDDLPGEFLETVRNFEVTPEIQRLMYDSPIADMISVLIGSEQIWLYSDEFFIKGASARRTPWHQDLPYWPLAGDQIASMWITLDPLTLPFYGQDLPPLPDIEAERDQWEIWSWDITPGDVVLVHPGVLHGGGPTSEGSRRRTLTVRCYGDDIVFAARPPSRPTVPLTPGQSLALKPGDPLRHP